MSLLSSVLNKLNKKEEGEPSPSPQPSDPMNKKEMAQRFVQFVMIQAQNIIMMLGGMKSPGGQQTPPDLETAKIFIEQLEMIEIKTRGNLSAKESQILAQILDQVRMAFVQVTGGTPHTMIPSRPMRGIPDLDELDDASAEEEDSKATLPAPKSASPESAPAPAEKPTPANEASAENKKKFIKSYG